MSAVTHVQATESGLVVRVDEVETVLSWRWVRDHGEDPTSFNPETKQRRVYAIGLDELAPAAAVSRTLVSTAPVIAIEWLDQSEPTWISERTLAALLAPSAPAGCVPWHHANRANVSKGEVASVLTDNQALRTWLHDLDRFGFAYLGGFSGGHEEVAELAARIGHPRSTIFGPTWDLSSDVALHDDTAYTQSFLAPHTDGTYSHEAPGLQMFCCIERNGTGGESVVVDGFAIAETLRTDFPEDFDILKSVNVPAHYIEPGVELRASRPAIRVDANGAVVQVSMNNYDRSPMHLPAVEMNDFYRAYGRLHELANDQDRWVSIRLGPGDVLITDNWRALHGRLAYTGARHFIGCYLNHEDFESRLRVLG